MKGVNLAAKATRANVENMTCVAAERTPKSSNRWSEAWNKAQNFLRSCTINAEPGFDCRCFKINLRSFDHKQKWLKYAEIFSSKMAPVLPP